MHLGGLRLTQANFLANTVAPRAIIGGRKHGYGYGSWASMTLGTTWRGFEVLLYPPLSLNMEAERTRSFSYFTTLYHHGVDPLEFFGITWVGHCVFLYAHLYPHSNPSMLLCFTRFTFVYSGRFLWEGRGSLGETLITWQGICLEVGKEQGSMLCPVMAMCRLGGRATTTVFFVDCTVSEAWDGSCGPLDCVHCSYRK